MNTWRRLRFLYAFALIACIGSLLTRGAETKEFTVLTDEIVEGKQVTLSAEVGGGTEPFYYQWCKDGVPIPGAIASTLSFTNIQLSDAGSYTVIVFNGAGMATSAPESLTVRAARPSRITNVSIIGAVDRELVVGFALAGGNHSRFTPVLARAIGPTLTQFGIANAISDPELSLFERESRIASNDDWGGTETLAQAATAAGAFPLPVFSRDAVLFLALAPTSYTAHVRDKNGSAGLTLVEVYALEDNARANASRLINASAQGMIGRETMLIAGFTIQGDTSLTVLLRGIGPALIRFGVAGALNDPRLTLLRGAAVISTNERWDAAEPARFAGAIEAVGAFALSAGSQDAAIIATLEPGSYTARVTSASAASGNALVEIYDLH